MTTLQCGVCDWVAHESEWRTLRGHERHECSECGAPKADAFEIDG